MTTLQTFPRAKINLFLKVIGRRDDGYHELETLFQEIDLCDRLTWQPGPGELELEVSGMDVGPTSENLVTKAAQLYTRETGHAVGGHILLEKGIPAGGGLGGGSSDAASMLKLANRTAPCPLSLEALAALAIRLGSDVPFFLFGGMCLGKGRGEILTSVNLALAARAGFLFIPPFRIATRDVFRAWSRRSEPATAGGVGSNDLLEPALEVCPELRDLWALIRSELGESTFFMSGSGSTLVWLTTCENVPGSIERVLRGKGVRIVPFVFVEKGTH